MEDRWRARVHMRSALVAARTCGGPGRAVSKSGKHDSETHLAMTTSRRNQLLARTIARCRTRGPTSWNSGELDLEPTLVPQPAEVLRARREA